MTKSVLHPAPPGIRVQLTIWYTIVSSLLMLIFGIAFYSTLQASLASSVDTTLQLRTQQVAEGITTQKGKVIVDDIVGELPELDATVALLDSSSRIDDLTPGVTPDADDLNRPPTHVNSTIFIRIIDKQGNILYKTTTFDQLTMPAESLAQPLKGIPWRGTVSGSNGQSVRIFSTMLVGGKTLLGVVQIGQSLADLNARLQAILLGLFIVTPFVLLLSAFGSYWLAGRAFRPIHRLARTAREISAKDLHQRVPVPLAHDEVRELSLIFNQMIGRLEKAFTQQRRFVADASHELRTPVAVIRNMTEVALTQPDSTEDFIAVLSEVNAESERLSRLISDLLVLARADEKQVQLDCDPIRLDLLTADVVESLESLAHDRQITLITQRLDAVTILGDAARLIQVIMGLVDNALTYTNAGGAVTLSVASVDGNAYLSVRDTGIGIAPEDREHIFERFYRADPARSRAVGGCGLGLAIADWVVRSHQGSISVESQVGKGSIFTVMLPLVPSANKAEDDFH